MKPVSFNVAKTPLKVTITGSDGFREKSLVLDARVFEVLESCEEPVGSGELQRMIAHALRIPAPGGRSSKACSILERYTPGYGAFNGWCALLIKQEIGKKRGYKFNPTFLFTEEDLGGMLTKLGRKVVRTEVSEELYDADLDIPDNWVASAEDMNDIIDQAYVILGYDPKYLDDEAPDLTYEEAAKIWKQHRPAGNL